jgi:hypothetical protein
VSASATALSLPQRQPEEIPLQTAKYYSPRIDRDLVSLLFHSAKARRIPMTRLASSLVREGLARMERPEDATSIVCEEPPALDPRGQKT